MAHPAAVVVGHDRFGHVGRVAQLLQQRGYPKVTAIVDAPEHLPELIGIPGIRIATIGDPLSSFEMTELLRSIPDFSRESPCLCLTDKPMFAYTDAFDVLIGSSGCWVPTKGIRNARMKARARALWDAAGLKGPRWRVLSGEYERDRLRAHHDGDLPEREDGRYIVKPRQGSGSAFVTPVVGWRHGVLPCVDAIRHELQRHGTAALTIDHLEYFPDFELLVEEEMQGPEYTVDGFVQQGLVDAIVQHKESKRREPFFGDGLIVSPPDSERRLCEAWPGYECDAHSGVEDEYFINVVRRGLRALGIDNWAFHAEMIVVDGVPQFVELNPRPAGGLLWQTAGIRLGVDPIQACVDLHLRRSVRARYTRWVTGQFPIYAEEPGEIIGMVGVENARTLAGVHDVRVVVPNGGVVVKDLNREHYLSFVSTRATNHKAVRSASHEAKRLIKPRVTPHE